MNTDYSIKKNIQYLMLNLQCSIAPI